MKKLLILSIAIFSLVSCSSNDENLDPFVGNWGLFSRQGQEVSDCIKKGTITVKENGTYSTTSFYESNGTCNSEGISETGKWVNKENSTYGITETEKTTENILNLTFKDNNNTFVTTDTEEDNGTVTTYTSIFKRK